MPTISANINPADVNANSSVTTHQTVQFTGTTSPGATVKFTDMNTSLPAVTTTTDASGNYSITTLLVQGSNTFQVTTQRAFGQTITGTLAPVTYQP